jgi:hypothetical protein
MRNLIIAILSIVALGVSFAARAQSDEQSKQLIPVEYQDNYGHWKQCADVTGMCGVTTG